MSLPADFDPRFIRPFVDLARYRLALLPWEEVERELARKWAVRVDAPLVPWQEVADDIRHTAMEEMRDV